MRSQIDFQNYIDTGTQAYAEGDYATGGKIFLAAMKDAKRAKLKDARLVAILYNLALFYHQQKRPKKSEVLLEKALEYAEALFGRNSNPVNHILNRLADLQIRQRHYKRAENLYHRSLLIERRTLNADNPLLAKKLMKSAWVQALQSNYDDAETFMKEALSIQIGAARDQQALASANPPAANALDADLLFDDLAGDEIEFSSAI